MKKVIDFYKQTSLFTELGKYKEEAIDLWQNKCNRSLKKLCLYLMNVTIHRVLIQWALEGRDVHEYGDFSFIDYSTPMSEDDIFVTASAMFTEIYRRDEKGFYIGRPVKNRLNLTCRYVSVLTSAILKANGIPTRSRAGWARYLTRNKNLDHWVNEYWNDQERRWVMFDLDDLYEEEWLEEEFYKENKISKEYLDFGKNQYYTAAEMWLKYRKDPKILDTIVFGAEGSRPEEILKYLFLDFWAVMNFECNYTFIPMSFNKPINDFTKTDLKEIDNLARLMLNIDKNFAELQKLFNTPKYRMPISPLVGKKNYDLLIAAKKYKV